MAIGERGIVKSNKIVKVKAQVMSQENQNAIEKALIEGDLGALNVTQRLQYMKAVCKSVRLNPLTKPFDYIKFEGKICLYINRGGTEQLRMIHKISTKVVSREFSKERETYTVTAQLTNPKTERQEEAIGVVSIAGLRGKDLANACMRAETKAKRRATLALCGLSAFDTPNGEDLPIKESRETEQIESVEERIETAERPEFESIQTQDVLPQAEQAPEPAESEYRLKTGKTLKGKVLIDLPAKKLRDWIEWFDEKKATGWQAPVEAEDDAFHIRAHLDGLEFSKQEVKS